MNCLCGRSSVWVSSSFENVCVYKNFIHIPAIFSTFSITFSFVIFRLLHFLLFHFTTNLFVFTFVSYFYIFICFLIFLSFLFLFFFFNINAFVLYFFVFFFLEFILYKWFLLVALKTSALVPVCVAVGSLQLKLCLSFLYNQSYIYMQCYGLIL